MQGVNPPPMSMLNNSPIMTLQNLLMQQQQKRSQTQARQQEYDLRMKELQEDTKNKIERMKAEAKLKEIMAKEQMKRTEQLLTQAKDMPEGAMQNAVIYNLMTGKNAPEAALRDYMGEQRLRNRGRLDLENLKGGNALTQMKNEQQFKDAQRIRVEQAIRNAMGNKNLDPNMRKAFQYYGATGQNAPAGIFNQRIPTPKADPTLLNTRRTQDIKGKELSMMTDWIKGKRLGTKGLDWKRWGFGVGNAYNNDVGQDKALAMLLMNRGYSYKDLLSNPTAQKIISDYLKAGQLPTINNVPNRTGLFNKIINK